ncbi:hypothetical protein Droror1_Dr00025064 [Drosera rotundifolia]
MLTLSISLPVATFSVPSLPFSPPKRRRSNPNHNPFSTLFLTRRCGWISGLCWSDAGSRRAGDRWHVGVGNHGSVTVTRLGAWEQGFLLLAFIALTMSVAFVSFVMTAVPTLKAMRRTAIAFSRLADTATKELPSTMAAVRLSGMEISDLTLELNELSQEISDGITKSAQAIQAAESGIRQMGSLAHQQTISMIQERAELPEIPIKPLVSGAARKTSQAVVHVAKAFINLISRGEFSSTNEDDGSVDR